MLNPLSKSNNLETDSHDETLPRASSRIKIQIGLMDLRQNLQENMHVQVFTPKTWFFRRFSLRPLLGGACILLRMSPLPSLRMQLAAKDPSRG